MRNYIPHIIVAILLIAVVFQCTDNLSLAEEVATEREKVRGLENEIVILDSDVAKLNLQKDSLNVLVGTLNEKIQSGKSRIITIRENRDEKIKIVSGLSSGQLQQFFSERYPE